MGQSPSKLELEGNFLNLIKAIYKNPTANPPYLMMKACMLSPKFRKNTWTSLSSVLFNIVLEVLASAIRQQKGGAAHPDWKGRSKTISIHR